MDLDYASVGLEQAAIVANMVGVNIEIVSKKWNTCWSLRISDLTAANGDANRTTFDFIQLM